MARQGYSGREQARMANIGGDIAYERWQRQKGREAQSLLGGFADRSTDATDPTYKGEKALEAARFISSFFGAPGKLLGLGLTGIDYFADKHSRKKKLKDLGHLDAPGNPNAKYLKRQSDSIRNQVMGLQRQHGQSDFMSALISGATGAAGTKFGGDLISKMEQPTKDFLANTGLGIPLGADKINIVDTLKKFLKDKVHPYAPAIGPPQALPTKSNFASKLLDKLETLPEGFGPSAFDVYDYARPQIERAFSRREEPLVPEVDARNRKSLRRRIR